MNETAIEFGKEAVLLRRVSQSRDTEAFAEITRRYAGMVYGTCLRVTGDAHHAADAAQETFYDLLKNAGRITGSLGCWLHRVATRRAVDLVRRDAARRRREQEYAVTPRETDAWADVSPLVDEALGELDPELNDILVRHYLHGQTMSDIAVAKGVSQPTISRRVEQGVEQLRDRLKAKGVLVAAATLGALLPQSVQSAPVAVLQELGKMGLTASGVAATHATTFGAGGLKIAAAALVVAGVVGYVVYESLPPKPSAPVPGAMMSVAASPGQAEVEPAKTSAKSSPRATVVIQRTPAQRAVAAGPLARAVVSAESNGLPPQPQQPAAGPQPGISAGGGWTAIPGTQLRAGIPGPTTPSGALWRFVMALSQSPEQMEAAFVPGATEPQALSRMLENPQTEEQRQLALSLKSIGIPVQILETNSTAEGLRVRWQARVHTDFATTENGAPKAWHVNDWFEMEARLEKVGEIWKVAGF